MIVFTAAVTTKSETVDVVLSIMINYNRYLPLDHPNQELAEERSG